MINGKLIKVCGMRNADNIEALDRLGIDLMGFIFYPKSPRYVEEPPAYLPRHAKRVGVFVNEDPTTLQLLTERFGLDFVQLHGNESPEYCHALSETGLSVIKAFSIDQREDFAGTEAYAEACHYLLFDTKCRQHGGSGNQFDWSLLESYKGQTPFLLSGGIGADSASALKAIRHPHLAGFDLNSRFEDKPGEKNIEIIKQFLSEL